MTNVCPASLRVLIAGTRPYAEMVGDEVSPYIVRGIHVTLNVHGLLQPLQIALRNRYHAESISFICFDPESPEQLVRAVAQSNGGFDAIVCPTDVAALTPVALAEIAGLPLSRKLRVIGCPNDSMWHLQGVCDVAEQFDVVVLNTPGVHADSVAEYTLAHLDWFSRRLDYFIQRTGVDGSWPHQEANFLSRLIRGRTMGVIGGSGRDGSAVIALSKSRGLRVISIGSGSLSGAERLHSLGVGIASSVDELMSMSDFISINCRLTEMSKGLIGRHQIELMKSGVIIINPSAAEIIDKQALIDDFSNVSGERRIGSLVLDMPYGGQRDRSAFSCDPDNALLKSHGVVYTPRIAGYTIESYSNACLQLSERIVAHFVAIGALSLAAVRQGDAECKSSVLQLLLESTKKLAREAASAAISLRNVGLTVHYKSDGSPATNADIASETVIKDGLHRLGIPLSFAGEESGSEFASNAEYEFVIDGIDGTRNFRDRNYGWCVSVACRKHGIVLFAVVFDPSCDELYYAVRDEGAFVCSGGSCVRVQVPVAIPHDFSYAIGSFRSTKLSSAKTELNDSFKEIGGRGREWGSVALSICAVARGGLGAYVHSRSFEYDHLAAALVAMEAGAAVSVRRVDSVGNADLVITHPSIFDKVIGFFDRVINKYNNSQ